MMFFLMVIFLTAAPVYVLPVADTGLGGCREQQNGTVPGETRLEYPSGFL